LPRPAPPAGGSRKQERTISGQRNTIVGPIFTGRPGWRQGTGEDASTWTAVIAGHRLWITRSRGMFCGELRRPSGGIMCVGERPTLLAAQIAIEAQAHEFGRTVVTPVPKHASIGNHAAGNPQVAMAEVPRVAKAQAPRRRPGDTDRDLYLRLTSVGSAA
jgi:hypothetical protein